METKTIIPIYTQKQKTKDLGCPDSKNERYRKDKKMHSHPYERKGRKKAPNHPSLLGSINLKVSTTTKNENGEINKKYLVEFRKRK